MDVQSTFFKFGISLAIGILVGLQREYAFDKDKREISAGIRTFGLMGLIGCAATMVAQDLNSAWPFVIIVFVGGALIAINFFIEAWQGDTGLTTEFSALLTILAGSLVYLGYTALAIATVVAITVLLSLKFEMHRFVRHLTQEDLFATLKFAVITAIILPVLPNKNFGAEPFHIFNPHKIWLLVVLISGVSFIGYILIKIVGAKRGIGLVGVLGGLASSTAVTLTMTQRSRRNSSLSPSFTQAILISWSVMYVRLLIIVAAVNVLLIVHLWIPVVVGALVGLGYSLFLYARQNKDVEAENVAVDNPFELGPAIKFGILFSVILLISKAAQNYLGDTGLYLASLVSGLADVDAISLSVAEMSMGGESLTYASGALAIVLASAANTLLKGLVAAIGGSVELRKTIIPGMLLMIVSVLAVAFLI